jgi:Ohr subfamily peroxiredoxin
VSATETESFNVLYTAEATASGGRDGSVKSSDGNIDMLIKPPRELGGPDVVATNPEQLFAAGYAACFHNALRRVAGRARADVSGSEVTARVSLGPSGEGGFDLAVTLRAALPEIDRATAERLLAQAHQVCPYSRATRGNIDVALELV